VAWAASLCAILTHVLSLICGADFGAVSVAIVSINSRSTWVLNSESMWI
jgi:hypothetical protein